MSALTLKVHIVEQNVTKVIQFDNSTLVYDGCRIVREKITEANLGQDKDYGLFLPGDENSGVWLEPGRELRYYLLKNQDIIEYRRKIRPLKVRMLDGMVKTLMVDDSQPVSQLMVVICTKIGIMNHDEYSLVREIEQEEIENKPNFGTLTLGRRRGGEKERDAKMETLKRKLKTDDEINWVDHSKTLREQGVDEHEVLLLKRKFFFSDGNIDSQDPIQLNLLYVQCRDAILDGTHPVTQERACEFAGIQCQIQFGEFVEARHKPGFLDLKEFLPQSYVKVKNIEKKVFVQHKKFSHLSEIDAKFNYVEKARSLKTYGVTFFLVKEKMKGRNKLVPRLLGVTKDSVLRLDEKTKEILKTWPLTTVRRWAASPNIFTLDFGDYSDQYFPFQTTEGEQIAQLIAGYIDIILKKQKPRDRIGIEGDEGLALQEDNVVPMRPSIIQHWDGNKGQQASEESLAKPAIIRPGVNGPQNIKTGTMDGIQSVAVEGQIREAQHLSTAKQPKISQVTLSRPQQALLSTIDSGQTVITSCIEGLDTKAELPELGTDPASVRWKEVTLDSNKQTVTSQIAAMNAATAEVVTLTSSVHDEVDHTAVGAAIHTITSNLPEMTRGVRMIAALMDDDSDSTNILDATKSLCSAFSDLLKAAEPERREPRQNLIGAATRVGDASRAVLTTIDEQPDQETQDKLLGHAKAVANTTAALILKAKAVASHSDDQDVQNRVINAATNCALATSQLVACAKVVAPTIDNPACKSQLIEATKEVGRAVESIVQVCQQATNDQKLLKDLSKAASDVTEALNHLLDYIKTAGDHRSETIVHEEVVENIISSSDKLMAARGNSAEMVRQAHALSQASTELVNTIEREASVVQDSDLQNRLYAAAKVLADATSKMVDAAKLCSEKPYDKTRQETLISAADNVRMAAFVAAGSTLRKKVIKRLENAAKHAAATATQCMAAAQGAGNYNTSSISQEELITDCKYVADVIPQLVEGVKGTINQPDSARAQLHLINSCNQFLLPADKMVSSVKAALPTVNDQASSMQLNNSSKQFSQALADLRTAMGKAQEACGSLEIESALDSIHYLDEELVTLKSAAWNGSLRPLPGETAETAAQYFANSSKSVGSNMAQLLTSASQGNEHYTGISSRDTAQALKEFSSSVRMVVATSDDPALRDRLIDAAREVMVKSMVLIEEARIVVQNPQGAASQRKLAQVAKGVSQALSKASSCLPGQKDVDDAIQNITSCTNTLESELFPHSNKPYGELQSQLTNAAAELNYSSADVVESARQSTQQLGSSSKKFSTAFGNLMGVGMEMAGTTKDQSVRGNIVISLKSVSITSSKLLVSAKSAAADPNAPNAKNALQSAARAVTDSINNLIDVCTSSAPGQKECENAVRAIQSMRPLLDRPSEPIADSSYFECLETVMDRSKSLGDGMTGIANHAKKLEHDKFGLAVKDVSEAICGLVESAAQAAYLVAISDRSSSAGRPGLVDQSQFARAYQAISNACQTLNNPSSNQQQVLSAATIIAKHTSALCNSCRVASAKTSNPVAKKHFVQSAKDVANATAHLVKEIKVLDQDYSETNRLRCGSATQPLLEAVENLCAFANSPEFASVPAKISSQARHAQEPITSSGKSIIEGSCAMIEAAKSLAVNPKDPPTWQSLANHSKSVSDSIKNLVSSIRDKAPGQRECDEAVDTLNMNIRDLDQASLDAIDQNLPLHRENNLLGYNEQVETACQALYNSIDKVRLASKSEAENLGHSVSQMATYFTPMVNASIGCSSNMTTSKRQLTILDQTKAVLECALQLLYAAKESGGNPKAVHAHQEIDESADSMKDALQDLLSTEESIATEAGAVSGIVESITSAMNSSFSTTKTVTTYQSESFVDYQTNMVAAAKEVTRLAKEMVAKSTSDPSQLANIAGGVSKEYIKLSNESNGAVRLASSPEMSRFIQSSVQELGQSCIRLVKTGGACQAAPRDTYCQKDLAEAARQVAEKVTHLLATLKESSQGTQACINAASTVSGIIGDLDTTIMFATAGTLNAENDNETFSDHRDNILKTARALVEDTKALVSGAASSQEQLAVAAHGAVTTIVKLAEVVKSGAASLSSNNQEAQVMLVNAVKDVAHALGDLIQATKAASGKSNNDPAIIDLKESAKVMVTNVTSLLKTVKNVEDEQMKGIQALEATIEAIAQELRAFNSEEPPKTQATPEDLVRVTKPITLASAKAVGVGMSLKQHDVVAASNMGRRAISDLLTTCKAAAWKAETKSLRQKVMNSGNDAAVQYRELLQIVLYCLQKQSADGKESLSAVSRKIAHCLTDIVSTAEMLKGDDWVDPEDPSYIAENELLGAANSIEVAARKLQSLRPRQETTKAIDEDMNFEDIILEACKSIAAATGALVKAASKAQRELVEAGKIRSRPKAGTDDGQWSEGLISAARLVAAATHSLCEAANALVQGHSSEEKLIASAKQVAGSTAQLLVACKVKADPNSEATKRLQEAGNKVKRATDNLVKAAQQAIDENEEKVLVWNSRKVPGLIQEIDSRAKILKKRNELMKAEEEYRQLMKVKANVSGQSDNEGNLSGYDSAHEAPTPGKINTSAFVRNSANQSQENSFNSSFSTFGQSYSKKNSYSNQSDSADEKPTHEIVDGPSFREAMNKFRTTKKGFNETASPYRSPKPTMETFMSPNQNSYYETSENVTDGNYERSYKMTTTSRSYHVQDS